ncbi:hypothetical protein HPP92_009968 [Vanilla planifolia]|uniref:Ubiquinol-cytochrome c chaperone domain-containing protein n=1 Tax=Vanilla planifolia TaxID=51239 RepID=A0A835V3C7_VANPL|nr:hypothetical protein HPP92_009968 [Vanilla planifolia]
MGGDHSIDSGDHSISTSGVERMLSTWNRAASVLRIVGTHHRIVGLEDVYFFSRGYSRVTVSATPTISPNLDLSQPACKSEFLTWRKHSKLPFLCWCFMCGYFSRRLKEEGKDGAELGQYLYEIYNHDLELRVSKAGVGVIKKKARHCLSSVQLLYKPFPLKRDAKASNSGIKTLFASMVKAKEDEGAFLILTSLACNDPPSTNLFRALKHKVSKERGMRMGLTYY